MQDVPGGSPCSSTQTIQDDSLLSKENDRKDDWPIVQQVQVLQERTGSDGRRPKRLGVTWSNLTVKGISNDAIFNENILSQFNPFGKRSEKAPLKTIIQNSSGCVKPGGMYPT